MDPLAEAAKSVDAWAASVTKEQELLASRLNAMLKGRGASISESLRKRAEKFADKAVSDFVQGTLGRLLFSSPCPGQWLLYPGPMRPIHVTVPLHSPSYSRSPFTHVQILRKEGALPVPITDVIPSPARSGRDVLPFFGTPAYKPLALSGKTLEITIEKRAKSLTFTGPDPLPIPSVRSQIEEAFPELVTFLSEGQVRIATRATGLSAQFQVTESDAAGTMGLPTDLRLGVSENLLLREGVTDYSILDPLGEESTLYVWRLVDVQGNTGPLSYETAGRPPLLSQSLGFFTLVQPDGSPVAGREVVLLPEHEGVRALPAVLPGYLSEKTDESGRVSFRLVQSHIYTMTIPGSSISHRFKVPVRAEFQIGDPEYALEDDAFLVRKPSFTPAVRRSLP